MVKSSKGYNATKRIPLNRTICDLIDGVDHSIDIKTVGLMTSQNSMGCPLEVRIRGILVAKARPNTGYCSGAVFSVVVNAFNQLSTETLEKKIHSRADIAQFQRECYGTAPAHAEKTVVGALIGRNLAEPITDLTKAREGDIVQFWRNNGTGHTVILREIFFKDITCPTEIRFWSAHNTLGYINNIERIGSQPREIDVKRIYVCRAYFIPE